MIGRHRLAGPGRLLQDARAGWISLPLGVVVWEIAGRASGFAFLPPFSAAVAAVWRMTWSGELPLNMVASLTALLIGYACAVGVGIPLGVVMGRYRRIDAVLEQVERAVEEPAEVVDEAARLVEAHETVAGEILRWTRC